VNINKIVIKILQGSVVTQIVLDGLTINRLVANFLCYMHAKHYENWLAGDKVSTIIKRVPFMVHSVVSELMNYCSSPTYTAECTKSHIKFKHVPESEICSLICLLPYGEYIYSFGMDKNTPT